MCVLVYAVQYGSATTVTYCIRASYETSVTPRERTRVTKTALLTTSITYNSISTSVSVPTIIILLTYFLRYPQSFEWPAPRNSCLYRIIFLQCLRCSAKSSKISCTMFCSPENTEASSTSQFIQFFSGRSLNLLPCHG